MIVEVLVPFYDKENLSHLFQVGDIVEFEAARAEDIISRGLGKCATEEAEKVEETEKADPVEETKVDEPETAEEAEEAEKVEDAETEEAPTEEPKRRGRKPTKVSE